MTDPNTSSFILDFGPIYDLLNYTYNETEFNINPETQPCNPFHIPDVASGMIVCSEQYDPSSAGMWRLATRILRHTLGFLIPLAIMLPCYGVTIKRLLHIRGGFQRQRAMRVIVFVVIAFLLCWTPYHIAVMADTFFRSKIVPYRCPARMAVDQAMFATQSLGLLHSCVNPVLYAFVGEKFRKNLFKIIRKIGVLERPSVTRSSRSSLSSEITSTFM
ncbi:hypothetical protein FQN60_009290 [Etheostoma spectabile]|uniref:G-protein coupled receptors family 1 profile domain-containing protein n=1 Tax=Etheostoma spectabile TaxID=54343 RepID=A0A5J5DIH0_9PERO|nr:hypothetical protein FQN60_009290 [Etheostoma spectabile]